MIQNIVESLGFCFEILHYVSDYKMKLIYLRLLKIKTYTLI